MFVEIVIAPKTDTTNRIYGKLGSLSLEAAPSEAVRLAVAHYERQRPVGWGFVVAAINRGDYLVRQA